MNPVQPHLDRLAAADRWIYRAGRESSAEPAAWTAMALAVHGEPAAAERAAAWLCMLQQPNGAVGVCATEHEPHWPTGLAMLAWSKVDRVAGDERYGAAADRAARWALSNRGKTAPRSPQVGHDTTLVGWSWAADTHSWLEPTCFFVLGLNSAGYGAHARTREGVRLVADRLLPAGGANYGNTIVLGQPLPAHLQPSGLAMLALAGEPESDGRVGRTLDYLEQSIGSRTAPASLALACLGLTAHGRRPAQADALIGAALDRNEVEQSAAHELALLLLAAHSDVDWLRAPGSPVAAATLAEPLP